jgi:phospholipase C
VRKAVISVLPFLAFIVSGWAGAVQTPETATKTPITHVIVVIAENRSFDHVFGVYSPPPGQSIWNLLSQGIVTEQGTPGPHFAKASQSMALVEGTFESAPVNKKTYKMLPPLMTDGAPERASDGKRPPFLSASIASQDRGLLPTDLPLLLMGATGLPRHAVDTRLPNVTRLPNGPYPLTPGIPYNSYAASPAHRFFQMWQQMDCSAGHASVENPSGCLNDLFPWVAVSVGAGSNGKPQPPSFNESSTGEGSTSMGFYNMSRGDAPYLKELAARFTLSDNYHQAVSGGTGANHIMLGSGDMIWYTDAKGGVGPPPLNQIEDPNPQPGTNNYYKQDGYKGGSYVACGDAGAPGVAPILKYLSSLPWSPKANCEPGHYYLVNNYSPGYFGNGSVNGKDRFTVPPSHLRTIGDALIERQISFRYYGENWNDYIKNPERSRYCNICNFLQYTTQIMTNTALRHDHISDLDSFYLDLGNGTLPAVSFIKPNWWNDGHPASSRLDIFEAFARRLVTAVQAQPEAWAHTAIFITFDEAGGYWDSGYIQPLDFFGDGPRVPLIAVSPYATGGWVVHSYTDHVSLLKFIERNWDLPPLTQRSRDNLPNPIAGEDNSYVPTNAPAIGDLMDMFHF